MVAATPDSQQRFLSLQAFLAAHEDLWRPAPFHVPRPAWCATHPGLAAALLALDGDEVARLAGDPAALIDGLASWLPALRALSELTALPVAETPAGLDTGSMDWQVPGRKLAQIAAFAATVGEPRAPVLEWCAGKGHLGRLLARHWGVTVTSLDHDPALCEDGSRLAGRARVAQRFVCADALDPDATRHLAGHHALALHACGDLHLALIRGAAEQGAAAVDIVPCCYYRTAAAEYRPLSPEATLRLSRDELHLPVTETVTAGARDRRQRDRGMAWKLAFLALRAGVAGGAPGRTFKPVPADWYGLGFAGWCRKLAAREGLALPDGLDWPEWEAVGWQRQGEVVRLDLVRLAFRRALELWLVLDRVLYLQRAGYVVQLAEFCPRALTPRNILISARR